MSMLYTANGTSLAAGGSPSFELVNTAAGVASMADGLLDLPISPPSIYVDLEGENLSRMGTVSILQIYASSKKHTYIVDVRLLGAQAFQTNGAKGVSLRHILESPAIPKVFFDVRNDSDALYSHFRVDLDGVHDLQLMELATRSFNRRNVAGLGKCIEKDALLSSADLAVFKQTKEQGVRLFDPNLGGSYAVFNQRPLSQAILDYCVQDVEYLPRLWNIYNSKMSAVWRHRVLQEGKERVRSSQSPIYNGKGRHMALAPTQWAAY
ncbi:hypothetical protein C8035_v002944 [Colletotrichum spinosum]|uniref:3'-5' exonuclease domain-containing protein n=1 Tax=Colletotrichum spinosum TaxID=1347390 RepID=A0A4R8PVS3_9PEZI|nr:hypothetical protein C8035_v002944 [Colletotrichum spinosum]